MTIIYDQYTLVVRITPAQCRAARDLLGWSPDDLARAAGVSVFTIRNFEHHRAPPETAAMTLLQCAFEGAGVRFHPLADDDDLGVSLANDRL
jgi:DNA-binding transcriptional regulator YiaG